MARGNPGIPKKKPISLSKSDLLSKLRLVDSAKNRLDRILQLEINFRDRISSHVSNLPTSFSNFDKFNTSPFVLLIHAFQRQYSRISEIEKDIVPAKAFSSMETSAGKLIEEITLPAYGWSVVPSSMHSTDSALDGRRIEKDILKLATLKSGPKCLNDEMSENFADSIIANYQKWAKEYSVEFIDFTYGVLYGTYNKSNKKDWHILRNIDEKIGKKHIEKSPQGKWFIEFKDSNIKVRVSIRIGIDWWQYLGDELSIIEICIALIRACVLPGTADKEDHLYTISDLSQIVSGESIPDDYNVSIMQKSQIPWLFFIMRHFCDELII